jgi:hypothetical protein
MRGAGLHRAHSVRPTIIADNPAYPVHPSRLPQFTPRAQTVEDSPESDRELDGRQQVAFPRGLPPLRGLRSSDEAGSHDPEISGKSPYRNSGQRTPRQTWIDDGRYRCRSPSLRRLPPGALSRALFPHSRPRSGHRHHAAANPLPSGCGRSSLCKESVHASYAPRATSVSAT